MIDITDQKTFDSIDMWFREVSKHGGENCKIVVVGNKLDLNKKRAVKEVEAKKWIEKRDGFIGYFELSAKEKSGYFDLFSEVTNIMLS